MASTRAGSFFNTATAIDALGTADAHGGRSLHARSHAASFIALAANRLDRDGLYLIDEPEAALSGVGVTTARFTR